MSHREVIRKHEKVKYSPMHFYTLSHTKYNRDRYMAKHWHNSIEITYVVKGLKYQDMENKKIEAKEGTLLLVNSGISHDVDVKSGLEGIVLLIDRNYIDYFCPEAVNKRFDLEKSAEAKSKIINYLLQAVENKYDRNFISCHICILKIIEILTRELLDDKYYPKEKHDDELYELIIGITEYLDFNYNQKITLDALAKLTNYNKTYLSSIFKQKVGITIFEYLRNIRMQHCLDDLKYSNESIVNIALNNGFATAQLFNRTFKKIYLMTPNAYRKQYTKK